MPSHCCVAAASVSGLWVIPDWCVLSLPGGFCPPAEVQGFLVQEVRSECARGGFSRAICVAGEGPAQPNHVTGRVPRCPVPLGSDIRSLRAARAAWAVLVLLLCCTLGWMLCWEGLSALTALVWAGF